MLKNKNILILSTGDVNGAYEAALRISKILHQAGFRVAMLVKHKTQNEPFIIQASPVVSIKDKMFLYIRTIVNNLRFFTLAPSKPRTHPKYIFLAEEKLIYYSGKRILEQVDFKPDLILSCLTNGFVNTQTLVELKNLTGAETLMVTMDMSPFTGGCHYAWNCTNYERECRNCPAIVNQHEKNLAHENLMIKKKNIAVADIKILSGSGWALNQARKSFLFKDQKEILNINSCIDTKLFNNKNREIAKRIFDLPSQAKIIFIGSQHINDERKGVIFAIEALNLLWQKLRMPIRDNVFVLIVGNLNGNVSLTNQIQFQKKYIDFIKDYRLLALLYQASTVFLCSSIEDAGPMMVSEALACGTPVVGFEMGVTSNMVVNDFNGYKAELRNANQLAVGLEKILLLTDQNFKTFSDNAVLQVDMYSSERVVVSAIENYLK